MKNWILIGMIYLNCLVAAENVSDTNHAHKLYKEGLKLEREEHYEKAFEKYKSALKWVPNNVIIRNRYISLGRSKKALIYQKKVRELNKIQFKQIEFEDVTIDQALEKLSGKIEKYNTDNKTKFNTNFVLVDKQQKFKNYQIRLKLRNVPLKVVLDNLMLQIRGDYKIEKYLISVRPKED